MVYDIVRCMRTCAADDCEERFEPISPIQLYCSKRCKSRASVRRLRARRRGGQPPPPLPPGPKGPARVVELVQSDRGVTLKADSAKHDRLELRDGLPNFLDHRAEGIARRARSPQERELHRAGPSPLQSLAGDPSAPESATGATLRSVLRRDSTAEKAGAVGADQSRRTCRLKGESAK